MEDQYLPPAHAELVDIVVPVLRHVYDINADRYDPQVGDDAFTFGSVIYRNSWFQLEQAFAGRAGWTTGRPDGSLTISNGESRFHVYRCGQDEDTDLDSFRLDDAPASLTKRAIAEANSAQLTLFDDDQLTVPPSASPTLHELVIVHAGNPDDGCCGIWVGAPQIVDDTVTASPWAWIHPLWQIDRPEPSLTTNDLDSHIRHDELPEPDLDIRFPDDADDFSAGEA